MGKRKKLLIKISVALAGITLTVTVIFFTPLWGTAILLSFLSAMGCYELLIPTGVIKSKTARRFAVIFFIQKRYVPAAAVTAVPVQSNTSCGRNDILSS